MWVTAHPGKEQLFQQCTTIFWYSDKGTALDAQTRLSGPVFKNHLGPAEWEKLRLAVHTVRLQTLHAPVPFKTAVMAVGVSDNSAHSG